MQNVRRHLVYLCYFDDTPSKSIHSASFAHIRKVVEQLPTGKMTVSGMISHDGTDAHTTNHVLLNIMA